jgi:methionyl-tRNA synthetase
VLPQLAEAAEAFLNVEPLQWSDAGHLLPAGHRINSYQHLMRRIEAKQIDALIAANRQELAAAPSPQRHAEHQSHGDQAAAGAEARISIDDFTKVDLRVARIVRAEPVEGADKLLRLELDLGPLGSRQVFAGIKAAYAPDQLQGRLTIVVANLAPRKMRFGISEGMVLAASDERGGPYLLAPDAGATPGMRLK